VLVSSGVRIASLLPAATEIVASLGAESELVGVSHECDFPASVTRLPRLTWSPVDITASNAAIDRQVRDLRATGQPVIAVDGRALAEARPDLVITQDLCQVCAVTEDDAVLLQQGAGPAFLALRGKTVAGVFADIRAVGERIGRSLESDDLIRSLEGRLDRLAARRRAVRPRVVCAEWLDPLYLAGHWVPELIAAAGGLDVGAAPGSHSSRREWAEVSALAPDIVVIMLCGLGLERARQEWSRFAAANPGAAAAADGRRLAFIDGNAYTSRPGPRIVEGAEQLARGFGGAS